MYKQIKSYFTSGKRLLLFFIMAAAACTVFFVFFITPPQQLSPTELSDQGNSQIILSHWCLLTAVPVEVESTKAGGTDRFDKNVIFLFLCVLLLLAAEFLFYLTKIKKKRQQLEKAEAEAKELYQKAQETNKAQGYLIRQLCHETKVFITGLQGMELMAAKIPDTPDKASAFLKKLSLSSEHLLLMANNTLDMSRIQEGNATLLYKPFDLKEILQKLRDFFLLLAKEKHIDHEILLTDDVEECIIGDEQCLTQILCNLLNIVFKLTPKGGSIQLRISKCKEGTIYFSLCFQICFTCLKGEEGKLQGLLQSFHLKELYEAEPCRQSDLEPGVIKYFCQAMGGQILTHIPEEGACSVTAEIPFLKGSKAAQMPDLSSQMPLQPMEVPDFHKKRILLAQDSELNRAVIGGLIRSTGAQLDTVENGEQAVTMFQASPMGYYHLLLMDIRMPILNGSQAAKQIRSLKRSDAHTVPIFAITADCFPEELQDIRLSGIDAQIPKPVDIKKLYAQMRLYLTE